MMMIPHDQFLGVYLSLGRSRFRSKPGCGTSDGETHGRFSRRSDLYVFYMFSTGETRNHLDVIYEYTSYIISVHLCTFMMQRISHGNTWKREEEWEAFQACQFLHWWGYHCIRNSIVDLQGPKPVALGALKLSRTTGTTALTLSRGDGCVFLPMDPKVLGHFSSKICGFLGFDQKK